MRFSPSCFIGLGFALCYTPAIAMVGIYFCERKALAYGIAMSGSGIGTFILAPVVQLLIEHYSWRGALLILGGFVSNLCVCGALLRPIILKEEEACPLPVDSECGYSVKPPTLNAGPTRSAASDAKQRCFQSMQEYHFLLMPDFLVLAGSFLLLASGCSLPFVYLVPYALDVGVGHQHAAFLMSILGVIDIVGNITFGWLTDRRYVVLCRLLVLHYGWKKSAHLLTEQHVFFLVVVVPLVRLFFFRVFVSTDFVIQ